MVNKVFEFDPPVADINITTHGSDWYWAAMALFIVALLAFSTWSFRFEPGFRIFHYLIIAVVFIQTIVYYSMAADLGGTPIRVEFHRSSHLVAGNTREIFYVRYIGWVLATPLLLLTILLAAAAPLSTILFTLFVNTAFWVLLLVGALTSSGFKWGYYLLAMFALAYVIYNVLIGSRTHVASAGPEFTRLQSRHGLFLMLLWLLYPIAWGVSEGGNVIAPDSEAAFYGVLDLLTQVVFGFLVLHGHRNSDLTKVGFARRQSTAAGGSGGVKV